MEIRERKATELHVQYRTAEYERKSHRLIAVQLLLPELPLILLETQWGRILSPEIPGSTMGWTRDLLRGDDKVLKMFPPRKFSHPTLQISSSRY